MKRSRAGQNSRWLVANSRWFLADSMWFVADSRWFVADSRWFVADSRCFFADSFQKIGFISAQNRSLSSTCNQTLPGGLTNKTKLVNTSFNYFAESLVFVTKILKAVEIFVKMGKDWCPPWAHRDLENLFINTLINYN
jgi:hypothetical protein